MARHSVVACLHTSKRVCLECCLAFLFVALSIDLSGIWQTRLARSSPLPRASHVHPRARCQRCQRCQMPDARCQIFALKIHNLVNYNYEKTTKNSGGPRAPRRGNGSPNSGRGIRGGAPALRPGPASACAQTTATRPLLRFMRPIKSQNGALPTVYKSLSVSPVSNF